MFGKKSIDQIIIEGDLEALKTKLKKSPGLLRQEMSWSNKGKNYGGTLLHMAGFYNHPDMVEYLVTEKGMDPDGLRQQLDPAAPRRQKQRQGRRLQACGPRRDSDDENDGTLPAAQTTSPPLKDFLNEKAEEYEAARSRKRTAAKAAGEWTDLSDTEIMFERTLPGGHYRMTKIFNFAAAVCTSITKDIKSGHISSEEKKFEELADQEIIGTARAKLEEIRSITVTMTKKKKEKPAAPQPHATHSYDKLRDLGK